MQVLVTGAGGFIGSGLVERLLARGATVKALDVALDLQRHDRLKIMRGSIAEPGVLAAALEEPCDIIFHLASVPGGLAEINFDLGQAVNVTATLGLLQAASRQKRPPLFVLASSIAVYGSALPGLVDDETPAAPASSYGTAKVVAEAVLSDLVRRGDLHGIALRLPGIVARPPQRTGAISIFLSDLIRDIPKGLAVTCPVSPQARIWINARQRCLDDLMHAMAVAPDWAAPAGLLLPATHCTIADLVSAIGARIGRDAGALVTYAPVPAVEALFGRYPPLAPRRALASGFAPPESLSALLEHCA